jgi:hypothetical protein
MKARSSVSKHGGDTGDRFWTLPLTWLMLQTTTDGKKTSVSGTLPSRVVWTVEFKNSGHNSTKQID